MTFFEILGYGDVGMDFSRCNMSIKDICYYRGPRDQLEGVATPFFLKSPVKNAYLKNAYLCPGYQRLKSKNWLLNNFFRENFIFPN